MPQKVVQLEPWMLSGACRDKHHRRCAGWRKVDPDEPMAEFKGAEPCECNCHYPSAADSSAQDRE